ncbi:hypothetical protein LSH36_8g13001 [Paralvinella palmiformis]|uniref:Pyrroline-5-carboxylate reductase catalytic N-terminal domain-containing protein n=1 Tax=Paralvinella palmiformis TaxID=53620 RepID=A0AAD9KDF3_9ANNE|nr:hypothetical protein LSH36_8g13001 [Paralvinella palmiformis]
MAVVPKLQAEEIDDLGDITNNLTSLQFESALTEEEKSVIHLRRRSHAHTVTVCAQATYFVSILNEARQIGVHLKNPKVRRASRLVQDDPTRDCINIGIIGCGRLGSHLAHCFLTFAEVSSECLFISTRRPETLDVECVSDNADVASHVNILFLCVLPSQFTTVAEEIRGHIMKGCIVYSLVSAVSIPRLKQLLGYNNIIHPEIEFSEIEAPWDYTMDITGAFCKREILEQTCPITWKKQDCVLWTSEKFAEQLIYSLVNICTQLKLSRTDTVDIVNAVVLGHSTESPLQVIIEQDDITKYGKGDNTEFPFFDLSTTLNRDTPITKKLQMSALRQAYIDRYCYMFQQYIDWRNTSLAQASKQGRLSFG